MKDVKNKHFLYKYWTIAYCVKEKKAIYEKDIVDNLKIINKRRAGIQADPFLIKVNGKNYLFFEVANPVTLKGKISCMELSSGKCKSRIVLKEKFHLSYPFVFEKNGNYYMIPESKQNGNVMLYRAKEFPWKWEREGELIKTEAVDTTLYRFDKEAYLFSYEDNKLVLYRYNEDEQKVEKIAETEKSERKRPAGAIFEKKNEMMYRPAQICENFYGEKIVIYESDSRKLRDGCYEEKERYYISPQKMRLKGDTVLGIHTYNFDEDYEVIDLYREQYGVGAFLKKMCWIPLQYICEKMSSKRRR